MWWSGRRTGCRLPCSGAGRTPAGTWRITDHIDLLFLLLMLWLLCVLPVGPRVRFPFLGHQAAGHGAIGPQVGTFVISRWPTRTFVKLGASATVARHPRPHDTVTTKGNEECGIGRVPKFCIGIKRRQNRRRQVQHDTETANSTN